MIKRTIITDDIKNLVRSSIMENPNINPLDVSLHRKFCVGNVIMIKSKDGRYSLNLPEEFNKEHLMIWKSDVGGVLLNELKQTDKFLFEHIGKEFRVLLKRIREELFNRKNRVKRVKDKLEENKQNQDALKKSSSIENIEEIANPKDQEGWPNPDKEIKL